MSHTKEPWAAYKDGKPSMGNETSFIKSLAGDLVTYGHLSDDDARRIVACVNACSGIGTEDLENILMLGDTLLSRINALKEGK